jgi:hypothetical protein
VTNPRTTCLSDRYADPCLTADRHRRDSLTPCAGGGPGRDETASRVPDQGLISNSLLLVKKHRLRAVAAHFCGGDGGREPWSNPQGLFLSGELATRQGPQNQSKANKCTAPLTATQPGGQSPGRADPQPPQGSFLLVCPIGYAENVFLCNDANSSSTSRFGNEKKSNNSYSGAKIAKISSGSAWGSASRATVCVAS